jgi:hypothetical protein
LENRALFVGRTFDCPDCHESLLIDADGSSGVIAKPIRTPARRAGEESAESNRDAPLQVRRTDSFAASKVADHGVDLQLPLSAWDRLSRRPAVLGWIVAALFASVLLVVVNTNGSRPKSDVATPVAHEKNSPAPSSAEAPPEQPAAKPAAESDRPAAEAAAEQPIAKLEVPPLPEAAPLAEPPRDEQPKPVPAPAETPKPPDSAVLSAEAVEARLRQKIARFDQVKPTPFVKLLEIVEELAGVPIVWDLNRVDDEQLQKTVTLQLKQTTVGEILDALLKQVGLERQTVEGKIELRIPPEQE